MKKSIIRLFVLTLSIAIIACAFGCTEGGSSTTDPSGTYQPGIKPDDKFSANYENLLKGDSVINISITLSDAYYAEIIADPEAEQYYSADVKIGSDTVSKAGFRTSGNTDLSDFSDSSQNRFSYKIKFDKYVEKQKYLKLDEMYLLNL